MIYDVVYCADCKKPLKSVPTWLAGVNVRFSCESCRQRHPRPTLGFDSPALDADPVADEDIIADEPIEVIDDEPIGAEIDPEDAVAELEV